jgi:serine protease Do
VLALIALARLRRTRHFRRLAVLAPALLAACLGLVTAGFGGLGVLGSIGFSLRHATMPVNEAIGEASPTVARIMSATAVVIAPMERDGDGKSPALGSAAVIATEGNRAWLLTNSHVAMPYAAVASWRHASNAHPVWVQFSDGRSAVARVAWTARPPLDVAVLEVEVADPPAPVQVAPDSTALGEGAAVTFVPLPYRDGWMVHHGLVLKREEHLTPAGPYSLLFTSLPVQPGDSGSGLFDDDGRLVGINTWTRIAAGRPPQGISLPSETMRTIVSAIEDGAMARLDELLEMPATRVKK